MADELHFSGKVRRTTLPVLTGPSGPDAPALKRLLLPQGELAQVHDADEGMRYLAFIELKPGTVRGNHFHRHKKEFIYIIKGTIDLVVEDIDTDTGAAGRVIVTIRLEAGDLAVIEAGVAHALRVVEPGHAIEFSPSRFDAADTHRHALA